MTGGDGLGGNEKVLELLDDPYARAILIETREKPLSAEALSEIIDASRSTVYRRIERLREQDLVLVEQRIDPEGNHYEAYTARLERVTIELTDDGFVTNIDRAEEADPADRFTRLYEEISKE